MMGSKDAAHIATMAESFVTRKEDHHRKPVILWFNFNLETHILLSIFKHTKKRDMLSIVMHYPCN